MHIPSCIPLLHGKHIIWAQFFQEEVFSRGSCPFREETFQGSLTLPSCPAWLSTPSRPLIYVAGLECQWQRL